MIVLVNDLFVFVSDLYVFVNDLYVFVNDLFVWMLILNYQICLYHHIPKHEFMILVPRWTPFF